MRILWISDSPEAPTGYGNVTRFVCSGLADIGHQIFILGRELKSSLNFGGKNEPKGGQADYIRQWQLDDPRVWHDCLLYTAPPREEIIGTDGVIRIMPDNRREFLLSLLRQVQPDVFITLTEVGWLSRLSRPIIANFRKAGGVPWLFYYAIDGDMGEGRLPQSWLNVLEVVDLPVAMSSYGRQVAEANGIRCAFIPHGVDTTLFSPPKDKAAAKARLGWGGYFVILSDARNHVRKLLPRTLEIFRRFAADKDDVLLALHCDPDDPSARIRQYCYDLRSDIELLGLKQRVQLTPRMSMTEGGIPLEDLATIYQGADVHLLASIGEGFGLPTLQAAAAGLVPLASDYTASQELVQGHGESIRVRHFLRDELGIRHALIDIDHAVEKLNYLYRDREALALRSRLSRCFAEPFDWKHIVPQWEAMLKAELPRLRNGTCQVMSLPQVNHETMIEEPSGLLTLPVTLPSVKPGREARVIGRIYVASASDLPVFLRLQQVFPGLNLCSSSPLETVGSVGKAVWGHVAPAGRSEYRSLLSTSTLALDLSGVDPELPRAAAELSVPCIGLKRQQEQAWLWPELSLEDGDVERAVLLGRWILTDQGEAAEICERARRRIEKSSPAGGCSV